MNYVIFITFLFISTLASARGTIKVLPEIEILSQKEITLEMLVEFENVSKKIEEKVKRIVIGNSPQTGERRVFTNKALSMVFRNKISTKELKKLKIIIPKQVIIKPKDNSLNNKNVEKRLKKSWQTMCVDCKFKIKYLSLPKVNESYDDWRLDVGHKLSKGSFNVPLQVFTGSDQKMLWIQGHVRVLKKVPVVTKSMDMHELFMKENVKLETRDVTFSYDSTPKINAIHGKKSRTAMKFGEVIWQRSMLKEKAIARGDRVKVLLDNRKFELSIHGQAISDGYFGDYIQVRNVKTKKIFSGLVVGKGEVEIK